MRIAFLTKRRYMRHDVIDDRYARLYELPRNLARSGHRVLGLCLSYYRANEGSTVHQTEPGELEWVSDNLGTFVLPGLLRHLWRMKRLLEEFQPDVILGASDAFHVALARSLARHFGLPYAVDLYDNFESFGLTRMPLLRRFYRRAVREADLVTCVSAALSSHVCSEYAARGRVETLESTIDPGQFHPRERVTARRALGLPEQGILIGTAGALDYSRGTDKLYQAFDRLRERMDDVHLVLAGAADTDSPLPLGPNIHFLGHLPHERMPELFGALDVGVICVRDTPFGRYSFPQKAYEMVSARIPMVVAAVGAMADLFALAPQCLYHPDDAGELATRIEAQIRTPVVPGIPVPTWTEQARRLEVWLHALL